MDITTIFLESLNESINIIGIIFVLMVVIELLVLRYKKKLTGLISRGRSLGYVISSFFGIIPGCIGTFAMDSLYMSGLLGFGGIVAVMVSTSGDEAFLMLSMAATGKIHVLTIIILTITLFVLGIIAAYIGDYLIKKMKIRFCTKCNIVHHKKEEFRFKHFLKEHILNHILKKHLWQIFLWLFAAIFIIGLSNDFINPQAIFSGVNLFYILVVASLIGLLPISGPNVFLVVMFSQGMIPFSILLANSIIQDGHGLLPILGFSMEDAVKIKVFNFIFGFIVGLLLLIAGI